jgi:hypothetical protein
LMVSKFDVDKKFNPCWKKCFGKKSLIKRRRRRVGHADRRPCCKVTCLPR